MDCREIENGLLGFHLRVFEASRRRVFLEHIEKCGRCATLSDEILSDLRWLDDRRVDSQAKITHPGIPGGGLSNISGRAVLPHVDLEAVLEDLGLGSSTKERGLGPGSRVRGDGLENLSLMADLAVRRRALDGHEWTSGTTILPSPTGKPTKRATSRILRMIRGESGRVRREELERKGRRVGVGAILFALMVHGIFGFVLFMLVFVQMEKPPERDAFVLLRLARETPTKTVKEELEPARKDRADPKSDPAGVQPEPGSKVEGEASSDVVKMRLQVPDPAVPSEPEPLGRGLLGRRARGTTGGEWKAVRKGLMWLARHQDRDGKWDWDGYTRHCAKWRCRCPHGIEPALAGKANNFSMGLTGLGLLCFLGCGFTHEEPAGRDFSGTSERYGALKRGFSPVVSKALSFLLDSQDVDGGFGCDVRSCAESEGYMYNQGICTLALVEAFHLTGDTALGEPCTRAVRFIERAQDSATGGWDYLSFDRSEGRGSRRRDVSVSSWQVMALKSARDAGIEVNPSVWRRAGRFFEKSTRTSGGMLYATGRRGAGTHCVTREHARRNSIGVTAAGVLSKLYLGAEPEVGAISRGVRIIFAEFPDARKLRAEPLRGEKHNYHTLYYWYYGTLVMFNLSGEYERCWRERLVPALKGMQDLEEATGSWPPLDRFLGPYGGRLYSTVFAILILEVFHRNPPLYASTRPRKPEGR